MAGSTCPARQILRLILANRRGFQVLRGGTTGDRMVPTGQNLIDITIMLLSSQCHHGAIPHADLAIPVTVSLPAGSPRRRNSSDRTAVFISSVCCRSHGPMGPTPPR